MRLEKDKYYVGSSTDVYKTFYEHFTGQGIDWTRMYKPLEIDVIANDEDTVLKDYIAKYGIENVRGGRLEQITCCKCGKEGHLSKNCFAYKQKTTKYGYNTTIYDSD